MGKQVLSLTERLGFSTRLREILKIRGFNLDPSQNIESATTIECIRKYFLSFSHPLDLSRTIIWKYLYRNTLPGVPNAILLCNGLNISFEWLLCGTGNKFKAEVLNGNVTSLVALASNLDNARQLLLVKFAAKLVSQSTTKSADDVDIKTLLANILTKE